jgi:tetratricopeptide (TPR) repeat protein
MTESKRDRAVTHMKAGRYDEALLLLHSEIAVRPEDWSAQYMAGQCSRMKNDLEAAVEHLVLASELQSGEAPVFLALGIARQLRSEWDLAIQAFRRAIAIDPDYDLAYNSLGLTYKKHEQFVEALRLYDDGANALARRIVNGMRNVYTNKIFKFRQTAGRIWLGYALNGAAYFAARESINGLDWMTGQQAIEEELTEEHRGLLWFDATNEGAETIRRFLPNYFNTFRERLQQEPNYANLIGNRGTVLDLLGRTEEAERHFQDAREFGGVA